MTSTATASVVCGPTLGDAHNLANCICILIATLGDGTPFSPNSFQEDALMELCMGLGQANLDGVFQILETEALFTFHSTTKMMATTCLLGVAMAWHNEPIGLHTCPPTTTHLRAHVDKRMHTPLAPKPQPQVGSWFPGCLLRVACPLNVFILGVSNLNPATVVLGR